MICNCEISQGHVCSWLGFVFKKKSRTIVRGTEKCSLPYKNINIQLCQTVI